MVNKTQLDDQEVKSPQLTGDNADIESANIVELLGVVSSAVNKLDGAGLEIVDGEVRVDSSVFDGTIEGLSNPLTADLDGSGFNLSNLGTVGAQAVEAENQIIQSEHIETKAPDRDNVVVFDQIGDFDQYIIKCDIRNADDGTTLSIRFRDAGEDDSGDYTYFDNDGTENSGQDAMELATFFGGNSRLSGNLIIYTDQRVGLTNNLHAARWDRHGTTTDYGGRNATMKDTIELELDRGGFQSGTELTLIGVNYDI